VNDDGQTPAPETPEPPHVEHAGRDAERAEHAEHAEDDAEAFELTPRPAEPERVETPLDRIEALALGDPGDDELRGHYLRLASSEGEQLRAANALARAAGANGPAVRERIWYDAATLYMQEAELPQARSAFMQSVLAGAGGAAGLAAARRVLDLDVEPHDPDVAAPALAFIAAVEPDEAARHDAARRLLAMHPTTALDDERLAVALQALPAAESIAWLSTLRARDPERATSLGRAAIEADPSGAAWLETLDAWLAGEPPADRIARYEAALAHAATPDRRVPILRTLAALRRESPGDLPAAVQIWQQLLAEDPSDREAIEGLLAASTKLDDGGAALAAVAQARPALRGRARHDVTVRTARALSRQGRGAEAVAMCRELMEDPGVASAVLQAVAEIAHDEDDAPLHAAALGLLVNAASPESKPKALERMGDFQIAQLRDPRAAAESWRAAAKLCAASPAEAALTQSLYERVIEALPDDCDAAEHLTAMHRQSGDWSKLPVVLRVLIRTATTEEEPCLLLLDLERSAIERSAAEEYVLLVDEVVARLAPGSTERARALKRSRARVLTADPARQDQASRAHREIVEAYGLEEDVRVFEAFVDARASALERHEDRRWLYRWRAGRDPRPIKVLLDWARAEDEFGETEAAIAVYQRLADLDPGRREALEALCRLKLHSGDLEGGLASLQALRDTATESDRRGVILRMARLLLEEMGRPAEAALALAPLFDVEPPIAAAHQMLQRTLADAGARAQVVERLEQLAEGADRPTRVRVYGFLLKARDETATMGEARRRWHERLVDLEEQPAAALQAAVDGAVEFPAVTHLWETAETVARSHGLGEAVSRAYHKVLVEGALAPALTESIARRMLAFEDEVGAASPRLVEALQRTLEVSPGARWAIDRVKLMLGSQARWDELFRVYDRAIAASGDDGERSALLGEAAFAAKDLAAQPERAIVYLESIHALRPDDVTVDAALERLYEKQGQTSALIELLDERLARRTGFQHRELLRKLASLWMDLGGAEEAIAIVDRLLVDGAPVGELTDLLERVAGAPSVARSVAPSVAPPPAAPDASSAAAQKRALALLRAHYESAARIEDVVRMAERELALAGDAEKRAACVRDLVGLRLTAAERTASTVFAHVVPLVEADVKADPQLAKVAFEALLQRALVAWKQPASPARDDASEGAWQTIHLLTALLLEHGKGEAALNLLVRIGRLPFERARRRELAREAAVICADRLDDGARAIKLFGELFEEDGGDEVAARSLQSFAALLAKAGELARLASLWEAQAVVHEKAGRPAAQRACFERAAALWEKQADMPRAIAAYGQAGKLGSAAAFEALSGIHAGRGDWAAAAEALQWLFDHAPPEARSGRALRLAEACAAVGDRGRARAVLEGAMPAAAGDPDAEKVPERLLALYREDAAWRPLAKLLAAQARRPGHAERRLAWLREASDLHWRKLDEPAEAAALLELAVSWYPQDTTHRPALADVFESVGQWDKAAAALRGQVALHRDQRSRERALVHQRLAHALAHTIGKAGRADEALAELRLAAEMHPTHPGILFDLGRGALSTGQLELAESTYRALLLALHSSAPSNGDGEAGGAAPHPSEVFIELSEIAARNDDAARAADLLDSAVDAALESGEDPKRFEAPLAGRGRHDLLARAAERRVERAATLGARAVALHDLAGLWVEHLARAPEMGARIARHAERMSRELEHEGLTDGAAWTALSEAHQALGDETARIAIVRRRADLLAAAIPGLPRGDERNRLRVELARTLLGDPAKTDEALKLLASAVEEDPARHKAADLLADALEKRERFADLARLLERRHAVEHPAGGEGASGPEAAASALRLARALDRADLPKEALPVYESIIDRLPADSLQAVVDRLAALGSERLADGLERMLALEGGGGEGSGAGSKAAADAGKTVDLAQRLLDLRDRAGDAAGARRALELGFAADPANKAFFRRLVAAYRDAGDRGATLRLLDPAVAARPDDVDLLLLRSQAREHLGDDDGALFDLETAAVADHRQVDTLVSLHERVLERQTARAEGGPLPATADVFAIRVIDVLLDGKRLDDARRELDRLLARTPDHADALERLAPLQLADGQWAAAVETYRKLLPVAEAGDGGDRERLVRVALAMADACERAGDAGASRDALERALAGAPESHEIMQRLERVCEVTGDVGRLANLLVSHAARLDDREERGRLLVRAANLLLDGAADPPGALRAAELALAANPESLEAVLAWAGAQRRGGHPHEAVAAIDRATSRAKGKRTPLLARLHLEAARAHLAVDEVVEAFESLKAGFAMDWRNPELSLLLGLVAIDLDDEKVAERALVGLTTTRDTGAGADLSLQANGFYRLALLAHARGDRAKTRRMAGRAIALEPEHAATRALLEQVEPAGGSSANRSGPRPALTPRS
jgi:DNA-binding SARP family transcriptional activator